MEYPYALSFLLLPDDDYDDGGCGSVRKNIVFIATEQFFKLPLAAATPLIFIISIMRI